MFNSIIRNPFYINGSHNLDKFLIDLSKSGRFNTRISCNNGPLYSILLHFEEKNSSNFHISMSFYIELIPYSKTINISNINYVTSSKSNESFDLSNAKTVDEAVYVESILKEFFIQFFKFIFKYFDEVIHTSGSTQHNLAKFLRKIGAKQKTFYNAVHNYNPIILSYWSKYNTQE